MDKYGVLKQYFGYSTFRPGQEALIDAILSGRDALGVMPTGGGKSLCYQVPALLLPGVTLVISPLISLMQDQVTALNKAGVSAACINSTLTGSQIRAIYSRARQDAYRLLYIAPERLSGEGFGALAREVPISLAAVDEAHCISQWGQDFRPSYLEIAGFLSCLPVRPVVAAFTATATVQVRADIIRLLALDNPACQVTGFDRPNLFLDVRTPKNKLSALLELLRQHSGQSGIVYCATRSGVDRVHQALCRQGIPAARYHAGMEEAERQASQDDFQFDRKTVMVATNAFGMGIDKSNVSFVIHYNMPKSLEAYYQEAGRAGRDGERADCILLYSGGDVITARALIESGRNESLSPEAQAGVRRQDLQRLQAMVGYCKTTGCLRGCILDYFGQSHPAACGNCGNCSGEFQMEDITVPAQMILSCIKRVRDKLGYCVGRTLITQVLRGSREQRVLELGLDQLSTYGLMERRPAGEVYGLIDFLETAGYIAVNPRHAALELTRHAGAVLFGGETLTMPVRRDRAVPVEERSRQPDRAAAPSAADPGLFDALRAVRTRLAQAERVPAYVVFSNAALTDMAARAPRTMEEFLAVSGVGQVKAERYGSAFLQAISDYLARREG